MSSYPLIADHGLIGDLQTAALVATRRHDRLVLLRRASTRRASSPRCSTRKGGHFRIAPEGDDYVDQAAVLPGHRHPDHPVHEHRRRRRGRRLHARRRATSATDRHRLVRMVRVVRGQMRFRLECQPRFDYGRDRAPTPSRPGTASSSERTDDDGRSHCARTVRRSSSDGQRRARATRTIATPGDVGGVVLETGSRRAAAARVDAERRSAACSSRPRDFWRAWIGRSHATRAAGGRWSTARR